MYNIGQVFQGTYPPEVAVWCNENNAYIEAVEGGYQIKSIPEPSLEEVKEAKIKELKQIRNTLEVSPIEYEGNLFDYDEDSRDRISIARQAMEDGLMESITWTTADNQRVEITLEDFKGINSMSALRSNGLHVKYNNKKVEVQSAKTVEEVEAIKWEG